jgi:hypothetical protein
MHKKSKKELDGASLPGLKKEMAQPRMAKSARTTLANLTIARIPKRPSITVSGTVDKLISSPYPSQPEKAQIAVGKTEARNRDLRIENRLTDEHGHDVLRVPRRGSAISSLRPSWRCIALMKYSPTWNG